jgi:hypothetical protein
MVGTETTIIDAYIGWFYMKIAVEIREVTI